MRSVPGGCAQPLLRRPEAVRPGRARPTVAGSHFDDVVTDRLLSLRSVQAHLDASKTQASRSRRPSASPVTDQFLSTEGLVGRGDPGGRVLTFATDMCVAELVDAGNEPVPPGRQRTRCS